MDEQIPISLERVEQPFGLVSMTERGSEAWLGLAFDEPPGPAPSVELTPTPAATT